MPATEQTWRDSKLLHLVFGISSLLMLVCTIWMLAADHRREWKTYQRKFQGIETWTAQARIGQQQSAEYEQKLRAAEEALNKARRQVPPGELVDQFNQQVRSHAEELKESVDLGPVDNAYKALSAAPQEERPARRDQLHQALTEFVRQARFSEQGLASLKKFRSADLDVARSAYEIGVGNALPQKQLNAMQAEVTRIRQLVEEATDKVQNAKAYRIGLESTVSEMFASETDARDHFVELHGELEQLQKTLYEREHKVMNDVIGLPIIDAFSPKKIDQIWLPKLTINYNFSDVARFDRCTNCHMAIDRTAPGSPVDPAYAQEHTVVLSMATPDEMPKDLEKARPTDPAELERLYNTLLANVYGLQLAHQGLLDPDDAVISVVRPERPAAIAALEVGDRAAERDALLRVCGRDVDEPLGGATAARGDEEPLDEDPLLRAVVASARHTIRLRHPAVLEVEGAVRGQALAALLVKEAGAKAGRVGGHGKQASALAQRFRGIGAGNDKIKLRHAAIRNVALGAVDHVRIAIAHGGRSKVDVRRVVIALMVGSRALLGEGNGERRLGVRHEWRDKPFLLFRRHGFTEHLCELPALVQDDSKAEIARCQFFAGEAEREDISAHAAKILRNPERAQPQLVRLPDPVPGNALLRRGQPVTSLRIRPNHLFREIECGCAPAQLFVIKREIHCPPPHPSAFMPRLRRATAPSA